MKCNPPIKSENMPNNFFWNISSSIETKEIFFALFVVIRCKLLVQGNILNCKDSVYLKVWNLIQTFLISGWSRVRRSESFLEIKRERHSIEGDLYWNLQCMRKVSRRGKNCYIHLLGNFLSGHSEDMTVIFPNIWYFWERLYYDQRIFKGFECR